MKIYESYCNSRIVIKAQQWAGFFDELRSESDRGATILTAVWLEELLERKLKKCFSEGNSDARRRLYDLNGTFSSFSSKIYAAYCLGWIDSTLFHDIDLVRRIRNEFAHELHGITLESPKIRQLIEKLQTPRCHYSDWDELRAAANLDETGFILYTGETPPEAGEVLDIQRLRYKMMVGSLVKEVCASLGVSIRGTSGDTDNLIYEALQKFTAFVTEKMTQITTGEPVDQLRASFENFMSDACSALSWDWNADRTYEVPLHDTRDRLGCPDYALNRNNVFFGYVKLKTPGVGADRSRFQGCDLDQFKLLSTIPNIILYTDGNEWALYRSGERVGPLVRLSGDITTDGKKALALPDAQELASLLDDFFLWEPTVPTDHRGKIVL